MENDKSQHYNFTHEALPILFHKEAKGVFKFLDKDGVKFLRFWWDNVGSRLPEEQARSSEGLSYQVKDLEKGLKMVFITLPQPREDGEVYYMAMIQLPDTLNPFKRLFTFRKTQVYSLEYEGGTRGSGQATGIYELTPRARNVRLKNGCPPNKEDFLKEVRKIMKLQ